MDSQNIESGIQFFSRVNSQNLKILEGINPVLFPEGGPYANQVIELRFEEQIDTTDVLIDFIVRAILPSKFGKECKGVEAVLINTDFQINLFKIIKFIEKKIEPFKVKSKEKKAIIEEALKNLIILNCYSAEQLEITFYNLERVISNCKNAGLVILDNILSQYWCAKFNNFMLSYEEHCSKTLYILYNKIKDLNVVLIYARQDKLENKKVNNSQKIIGYSIEIVKNNEQFAATVTNFEKESKICVPFKIDICPVFV